MSPPTSRSTCGWACPPNRRVACAAGTLLALIALSWIHLLTSMVAGPAAWPPPSRALPRAAVYCHRPVTPRGDEGAFPGGGATLVQVHLFLRHGDRSAIHELPGPPMPHAGWDCSAPSPAEAAWAGEALTPVRSTAECVEAGGLLSSPACAGVATAPPAPGVWRSWDLWAAPRSPGQACGGDGELSSAGWGQVHAIGAALAPVYGHLIDDKALFIATDYGRTMLTATGFLCGFGGCTTPLHNGTPSVLHVVPRSSDILLHPVLVGDISSPHAAACPALSTRVVAAAAALHRGIARLSHDLAHELAGLAGVHPNDLPPVDEVADDLFARTCAGHPLPCWEGETVSSAAAKPRCMSRAAASRIMAQGDSYYRSRWDGVPGLTGALMTPVLQSVLRSMTAAAEGASGPRFVLRAAHDTVIAPLLVSLGLPLPDGEAWPRYAARVSLELWRDGKGAFVRVIFNGEDVTAQLQCGARCGLAEFGAIVEAGAAARVC